MSTTEPTKELAHGNGATPPNRAAEEAKETFQRIYTAVLQGLCMQEKMTTNEDTLIDTAKRITQKAFMALFQGAPGAGAVLPPTTGAHPGMSMMMPMPPPGAMPGFAPPAAFGGMPNMPNNPPGVIVGPAPANCLNCGQPIRGPSFSPVCKDNHLPPIQ